MHMSMRNPNTNPNPVLIPNPNVSTINYDATLKADKLTPAERRYRQKQAAAAALSGGVGSASTNASTNASASAIACVSASARVSASADVDGYGGVGVHRGTKSDNKNFIRGLTEDTTSERTYQPKPEKVFSQKQGTVLVFEQKSALEDTIGSHACSLEAIIRVCDVILRCSDRVHG
jgi:hypothetical protein